MSAEVLTAILQKIANDDYDEASVRTCRVWGYAAYRTTEGMEDDDILYYSPRAGGFYRVVADSDKKDFLFTITDGLVKKPLPPLQKAILTTWIENENKNSVSYAPHMPMLTENTVKEAIARNQPIDFPEKKRKILKYLTHSAGVGEEFPVIIGDIAKSPLSSYKDEPMANLTKLLIVSESESPTELDSFLQEMDGEEIGISFIVNFGTGRQYVIKLNASGKTLF